MENFSKWKTLGLDSLGAMGTEIGKAIPNIIGAIVVLFIGWLLTKIIIFVVKKALKITKLDEMINKINEVELIGSKKLKIDFVKILLGFIKWTMFIIFLVIASDILNLTIISTEITNLLGFIPQLFSGLVIFVLGLLLANFVKKSTKSFFDSLDLSGGNIFSQILFLVIFIFATITAANQAGIDTQIITSNLTLIFGALLLAFAIAIGFGAQSVASDLFRTFYVRKTYEAGQKIEYNGTVGTIDSIDSISMTIKTSKGKLVIPIKSIVESEIIIQEEPLG